MTRFFDPDRWNEIWQTISRNRRRSVMTALSVFWGIFMLGVLLGAGAGLERLLARQIGGMSTNLVLMQSNLTSVPYKGMPSGRQWTLETDDVAAVKKLPEVRYAAGVNWCGSHPCSREGRKGDYGVMGHTPDYQRINPEKILYGRYINEVDMARKRKVCVIGTQVWKDLFPGGEDPTGKMIRMDGAYLTVVGVQQRQSSMISFSDVERSIVLPAALVQQLFGFGNKVHMLAIAGRDDVESRTLQRLAKNTVFARHIVSPDDEKAAWIMAVADFIEKFRSVTRGVNLLTWIVGLGTLLAGIVGVSNIMLVTIKERTQEIGIRRAIGAPPSAILTQILSESFVLTFIAGTLGLTAAIGVLSAADTVYYQAVVVMQEGADISWQVSFGTALEALAIIVGGSLLAGIIPALRALRIKAVDAIREE